MGVVNRYQVVAAVAAVIFVLGVVRAVGMFFTGAGADVARFSLMEAADVSLALPEAEWFPALSRTCTRDPFAAPSRWQAPGPDDLPPPPFGDLLRLEPTPSLLREDALPRLGTSYQTEEQRPDRELITRLRRVFRDAEKESNR